jgi:hypothetical protein
MHKIKVLRFGLDYLKFNFLHNLPQKYKNAEFASQFIGVSEKVPKNEVKILGFRFQGVYIRRRTDDILHFEYKGSLVCQLKKLNGFDQISQFIAYSFDFYSTFFCFPELNEFYKKFYEKYGSSARLSRVDIACDLNISMKDFVKSGYTTSFKKSNAYGIDIASGIPETLYFGSKSLKNKRHLIRVYDKLKDSKSKGKFNLYKNYFSYKHVTRIEVEIRSTSCSLLRLYHHDLFDEKLLKEIFTTLCINPKTTKFNILDGLNLKSSTIRKLSVKKEHSVLSQELRFKRLVGSAVGLYNNGYPNILFHMLEGMRDRGAYQNSEELQLLKKTINNYTAK